MLRLLTLAVALQAPAALAQSTSLDRLLPLEVGNEWTYSYVSTRCTGWSTKGGGCTTVDSTLSYRVESQVVEGADTLVVIRSGDRRTLFGFRSGGSEVVYEPIGEQEGEGPLAFPFDAVVQLRSIAGRAPLSQEVTVGPESYAFATVWGAGPPSQFAVDVGLVYYFSDLRGSGGRSNTTRMELEGAVVNTFTYGTLATATEMPAPSVHSDLEVWPNPTLGRAIVRLALSTQATVRLDVIDVTGRVVWKSSPTVLGAGDAALPVSLAGVPPGAYVVRAVVDGSPAGAVVLTRAAGR
ncbi:T9SS type A sorting domain-containing protein [Rubrivirga sp.]|uniref:T9SS type A sorting domain-containing protein n=1 Tax=Rubrivirga sp. TaxID=1885344 RepID=UPI003B52E226